MDEEIAESSEWEKEELEEFQYRIFPEEDANAARRSIAKYASSYSKQKINTLLALAKDLLTCT